jgi:cytoskeletal protein RodZ
MSFFKKIQNQPEHTRKIIFWSIIIVVSLILMFWWIKNFQKRLENFKKQEIIEQFKIPSFKEELKGVPKIDIR